MAKAARSREESETKREEVAARVIVTNLFRTQPVSFHYCGGSTRLGPLESKELDRSLLVSPELAHLIAAGAVQIADAPARAPRTEVEAAAPEGERPSRSTAGEK